MAALELTCVSGYTDRRMSASETVLQALQEKKVRPTDLAEALGVSVPFASQILAGKRGIRLIHLDAIAVLLGTTVGKLFAVTSPVPAGSEDASSNMHTPVTGRGADAESSVASRLIAPVAGTSDDPAALQLLAVREALRGITALVRHAESVIDAPAGHGAARAPRHRVHARKRRSAR
jgi:transcriptional regulator with XRE-family HTH domain